MMQNAKQPEHFSTQLQFKRIFDIAMHFFLFHGFHVEIETENVEAEVIWVLLDLHVSLCKAFLVALVAAHVFEEFWFGEAVYA